MAFLPKFPVTNFRRSSKPEQPSSREASRQLSMSLTNKGLLNPSGHNNCFLNSCVQVLWHVDVFRRSFRQFKGHTCVGDSCIFCALQELFTQFQHSRQSALPPDDLRQALARCYQEQHRFQLGIMDDAAECFEKILEQIHFHLTGSDDLDSCSAPHCLSHQKCALSVLEMTECQCGETSEPLAFVQFVHYISAPSLGAAAKKKKKTENYPLGDGELFGRLVRVVSGEGEGRECETCHRVSPIRKMLLNSPDLVCIGMIWDSDQPNIDDIMSVVESVGTIVRVSDMFHLVSEAGSKEFCLSGMVAYYGHHYCTFCYHTVLRQWGFFDDANFRTIGSNWRDVVELCRKAHYQPLLLIYANPFADKITMTTAPVEVTRFVATDTKTNALTPVAEEAHETTPDAKKSGKNPLTTSGAHPHTNTGSSSEGPTVTNASEPASTSTGAHSGTKSGQDSGFEIDPNTFSLRRRPTPSLYPQLSQVGSEGGKGERGGGESGAPVASAPPLQAQLSPSHPKTNSNFPVIFQSSPSVRPHPPASGPLPSLPVLFQSSPSAPTIPARSQPFPPFTRVPPSHPSPLPNSHSPRPYQQPPPGQRGTYSNAYGGYPSPTTQSSSWRGGGVLPALLQPSQPQPSSFFLQSSPRSSPSLLDKTRQPQRLTPERASGPSSLPGSPAKQPSHGQRASSVQPATSSSSSSRFLARPRPSPAHSVPPPNQSENANTSRPPPTTSGDSSNLIEFSLSPSLLARSNQPPSTQGHSPAINSSFPSSTTDSDTSREASPYRPVGSGTELSSVEEDLIQLSLSPGFIQKVQKYRGRQGVRQASSDNFSTLPLAASVSGRARPGKIETGTTGGSGPGSKLSGASSGSGGVIVNPPTSGGGLLVDVGEKTGDSELQQTAARQKDDTLNGDIGGEREQIPNGGHKREGERERYPDPLYADPDEAPMSLARAPRPEVKDTPAATPPEGGGGGGEKERLGLGEDPLYAVPEKVAAKLRARRAMDSTQHSPASTHSGDIPESVEPVLREALEAWQKAESKRERDVTLARMNYSRAATLLMKVLVDPAVDPTLRENISHKRREALAKCSEMEALLIHSQRLGYGGDGGRCSQCGQLRQLNSDLMCGPCHLKNKISHT